MNNILQLLGSKITNIASRQRVDCAYEDVTAQSDEALVTERKSQSSLVLALQNIRDFLPHDVKITAPDSDVGNIRVAAYVGEHYKSVFPFLAACRGSTLHSECVVYAKTIHYKSLKRSAEILQNLGAIEITMVKDEEQRIYFILRDSTLLDYRWVTGYTAKLLTKNFHGMPLQYVLHARVQNDTIFGSFDAMAIVGKTLFALRFITQAPNEFFFERLHALAQAMDLPDSKIVLPVLPIQDWRHIVEKLRSRGYSASELGSVSDVLQHLRREEMQRHWMEQKRSALA
jgi:hypothetical protein